MNEPTLKLPPRADELLKDFPLVEPDFEAQAKAIEARLKGDGKVTDPGALLPPSAGMVADDLFKAPELAAEAGEPGQPLPAAQPSSVRVAEPPKSNFAEMARKSVQKPGDDSTAIAKELLAATAQSRRPSAEMVERVRAAGRASATTTPLPTSEVGAEDVQRTSGVVARAAEPAKSDAGRRGTLIGIAGGVLALAACIALFVKSGESEQGRTTAAMEAEKASQATAAAPQGLPAGPTEAKPSEGVMSPDALAASPAAAEAHEASKGAAAKSAPGLAGGLAAPSRGAASAGSKPLAVVLEDDPEPAKAAAPEQKPEATPEPVLKPAEGSAGGVPLTPSAGAISSALGAVRGSAQACLAGQTDPVTAMVTFAADGHVLRVAAKGPAAGCIQAALSKAHIQPFAKESFSAPTTIRPP